MVVVPVVVCRMIILVELVQVLTRMVVVVVVVLVRRVILLVELVQVLTHMVVVCLLVGFVQALARVVICMVSRFHPIGSRLCRSRAQDSIRVLVC
jgi:hypothetical protein